ncbi:MAG: hypothetical protein ACKVHE_36645, partial [Planctomycetales bacterium]
MKFLVPDRCIALLFLVVASAFTGCENSDFNAFPVDGQASNEQLHDAAAHAAGFKIDGALLHVFSGQEIQRALDLAAKLKDVRVVRVHEGVYKPSRCGQAFIRFNARHSGLTLEAEGNVTLTARNADVASTVS